MYHGDSTDAALCAISRITMKDYAEIEISVAPKDNDGTYPLEGRANLAGEARGRLRLPTDDPEYQNLAAKLLTLDTSEAILTRLGQKLFDALFQDQVRDLYLGVQGAVQNNPELRLRIKLIIGEQAAEVAALPWEFLHDPDRGPLALLDGSIVRYPELPAPVVPLAGSLPLRVLLTSAVTPPPTSITAELDAVEQALQGLGDQVTITKEPHLTGPKLQRLLRRDAAEQFHVWHFVGHGGVGADASTGMLALEDPNSPSGALADPFLFSALQLRLLLNRSGVRLIVLDACETARLGTDAFRSLAPALIRAQVPAVVAMQFPVPDDVTVAFATEFYRSLAEGLPIDACINEGRKAIMVSVSLDRPDWGIPVVYTRAADGRLFDLRKPERAASASEPAPDLHLDGPRPPQPPPDPAQPIGPLSGINIGVGSNNQVSISDSPMVAGGVQTIVSGPAAERSDVGLKPLTGVGGAPLAIRTDDAVRSESQFTTEVNDLSQIITLRQQRLNMLQRRVAAGGIATPPEVTIELQDKEPELLTYLQQRIELRLGRLLFLKEREQAAATRADRQQLEEQIRAISYEYLSDAITLKNAEVRQLQARANNALDLEREQLQRRINEIRTEVEQLAAQRARLGVG